MWAWLSVAAAAVLATGVLPLSDAADVLTRIAPIVAFLAAVTVVAELADGAGVFSVAADRAARLARGSVPRLYLLVAALAALTTVVLSLDTTAVLLTPVVLLLAARLNLPPLPFALTTVWLANTASLLLPVSNLTNLLAAPELATSFSALLLLPALAVLAATMLVLGVRFRRSLRGRYVTAAPSPVPDLTFFVLAVAVCVVAGGLFAAGVEPWIVASAGAGLLLIGAGVRARRLLSWSLLPWRLVLTTVGLFLVVQGLVDHGLASLLADLAGRGSAGPDLLRLAGTGALTGNVVNNLPAYLALEPVAGSPDRVAALLIGVNAGVLVTPWASLATLLWWDRCRAAGVHVPVRIFVVLGLTGVPVVLVAGVGALILG